MTTEQGIVFAVLAATLVLFIWNRLRFDVVAMLALLDPILPSARILDTGKVLKNSLFWFVSNPLNIVRKVRAKIVKTIAIKQSDAGNTRGITRKQLSQQRSFTYEMAMREYEKKSNPYDGDVVLFRVKDNCRSDFNCRVTPYLGWERHITGKITIEELTECHDQITHKPQDLAAKMDPYLKLID